jgi:hypothetical protein
VNDEGREKLAGLLRDMGKSDFGQELLYDLEQGLKARFGITLRPDETPLIAHIAENPNGSGPAEPEEK